MAVPKKRVGHSAQGHRRSNWKATVPETTTCKNCGELVLTHTVCTACGFYKDKAVSIKSAEFIAETTEAPKKVAKKSTKKETKATEVVAEEVKVEKTEEATETVVEETKAEGTEE